MYRGIDLKGNEDIEYVVASIVSLLNLSSEVQRKLKKIRRGQGVISILFLWKDIPSFNLSGVKKISSQVFQGSCAGEFCRIKSKYETHPHLPTYCYVIRHPTVPRAVSKNIRQTLTKTNKKAYQIVSNDIKWCQIMQIYVCLSFMFHGKHIRQIQT